MVTGQYIFPTQAGHFAIISQDELWHAMYEDEDLGGFSTPQQALENLIEGRTPPPSCGDPSQFGLSEDLTKWSFFPF